jgi:hypothetical protein
MDTCILPNVEALRVFNNVERSYRQGSDTDEGAMTAGAAGPATAYGLEVLVF